MHQPTAQNDPSKAMPDPVEVQIQRVEKLAGFAAERAGALRVEFAPLWDHPGAYVHGAEAAEFASRIDALRPLTARYLREAARCRHMSPVQAAQAIRQLEVPVLLEAGRGLDAMAKALREHPQAQAMRAAGHFATAPASAKGWFDAPAAARPAAPPRAAAAATPAPSGLTGRLMNWLDRIDIVEVAPERREVPPPPTIEQRHLASFGATLGLVVELLAEVGPRVSLLQLALTAIDAQGSFDLDQAARNASVKAEMRALLPGLVASLKSGPATCRSARVAVTQWQEASRLAKACRMALAEARFAPEGQRSAILRPFDPNKLKGLILPLTNMHLTFRGVAALDTLFPPPASRRLKAQIPVEKTGPLSAADAGPSNEQTEATPDANVEQPKLTKELRSEQRLALIKAYMADRDANPDFKDATHIFRLVAEEREYQQDLAIDMGMRLRLMRRPTAVDPRPLREQRERFLSLLHKARDCEEQLQELLRHIAPSGRTESEEDSD